VPQQLPSSALLIVIIILIIISPSSEPAGKSRFRGAAEIKIKITIKKEILNSRLLHPEGVTDGSQGVALTGPAPPLDPTPQTPRTPKAVPEQAGTSLRDRFRGHPLCKVSLHPVAQPSSAAGSAGVSPPSPIPDRSLPHHLAYTCPKAWFNNECPFFNPRTTKAILIQAQQDHATELVVHGSPGSEAAVRNKGGQGESGQLPLLRAV
jgi:hypothetical protein